MKEKGRGKSPALSFPAKRYTVFRDSKGHLFMNDDTLRAYKAGIFPVIAQGTCEQEGV